MALQKARIKKIPEERLRAKDPDLVSFFNVNTPQDLARAEQLLAAGTATEGA
jgi:molybdopterin-guanine dinucleotide biosynthesis protein A